MASDLPAVGGPDNRSGGVGHIGVEEILHADVADEADALAVLFRRGGQPGLRRQGPDLRLGQVAERKAGGGELLLRKQREEIGLVLVLVGAFEQGEGDVRARGGRS